MSTGVTKGSRYYTQHMGEAFASTVLTERKINAKITGGGILSWIVGGGVGVFQWHSDMYIEFPTLGTAMIRILEDNSGAGGSATYGEKAGINEGDVIYITLPYLTTDDVQPAGWWNPALTPIYDFDETDVKVAANPLAVMGVTNENLFVLGFHAQDNQLFLRDGLVLNSGIPSGFGTGGFAGGRSVGTAQTDLGYAGAGVYDDIGFDFLPGLRHFDVWVNGVLQTAGVAGGGVDGYRNSSIVNTADFIEIAGTGVAPFYRGIEFVAGNTPTSVPAAGEEIIVKANVGGQGPQGPAGPLGGLQACYDEGKTILLLYNGGTNVQSPIVLEEGLAAVDLGAGPAYPLVGSVTLPAIEILRTVNHPEASQQQKLAAILDATGNAGLAGVFLYNPYGYGTLEQAMDAGAPPGRDGIFFVGMDDLVSAATKEDKLFFRYMSAVELAAAGTTDPRQLQILRQESTNLESGMSPGGVYLRGQVVFNKHGEIAAGWGKDFIRWYVLEVVLTPPGAVADTNVMTPMPIDPAVIEPGTKFCGGTAILPYAAAPEIQEFFHGNPTTAFVGANLYELKLAIDDDGSNRNLLVTFGRELDGFTTRIILFFSSEGVYSGEEI